MSSKIYATHHGKKYEPSLFLAIKIAFLSPVNFPPNLGTYFTERGLKYHSRIGWEISIPVFWCPKMRARVEIVDMLSWNQDLIGPYIMRKKVKKEN